MKIDVFFAKSDTICLFAEQLKLCGMSLQKALWSYVCLLMLLSEDPYIHKVKVMQEL